VQIDDELAVGVGTAFGAEHRVEHLGALPLVPGAFRLGEIPGGETAVEVVVNVAPVEVDRPGIGDDRVEGEGSRYTRYGKSRRGIEPTVRRFEKAPAGYCGHSGPLIAVGPAAEGRPGDNGIVEAGVIAASHDCSSGESTTRFGRLPRRRARRTPTAAAGTSSRALRQVATPGQIPTIDPATRPRMTQ
jgi:hypothetical protein